MLKEELLPPFLAMVQVAAAPLIYLPSSIWSRLIHPLERRLQNGQSSYKVQVGVVIVTLIFIQRQ